MKRRGPGGTGAAFEVRSGQTFRVTDLEGKQVVDAESAPPTHPPA